MKCNKVIAAVLAAVCMLPLPVLKAEAASQGTKGDELQVMQAEQLEVRLGPDWAGETFTLETDAGMYPGDVVTDEEGVLHMEVGGSSRYILTRVHTETGKTDLPEKPAVTESEDTATAVTESLSPDDTAAEAPEQENSTVAGIPVIHLALFGGGMLTAVGTLVWISVYRKKQRAGKPEEEEFL